MSAETEISAETGISSETAEGERRMQEQKRYRHGGEADQKAAVRLDFSINVNPLGLPWGVKKVLQEGMDALTRYPDPECSRLRETLSKRYFLPEEDILCGNGASELLMLLALARKPKKVLLTAPSFFGYERAFERIAKREPGSRGVNPTGKPCGQSDCGREADADMEILQRARNFLIGG